MGKGKGDIDERFILFYGRMQKYKGLEILIEASKMINAKNIKVVIAGKGPASILTLKK